MKRRSLLAGAAALACTTALPERAEPGRIATDHEGGPVVRVTRGMALTPAQMALAVSPDPEAAVRRSATLAAKPALVAAVDVMTGMRPPLGRLPVEIPGLYPAGAGLRSL